MRDRLIEEKGGSNPILPLPLYVDCVCIHNQFYFLILDTEFATSISSFDKTQIVAPTDNSPYFLCCDTWS